MRLIALPMAIASVCRRLNYITAINKALMFVIYRSDWNQSAS